MLLENCLPNVSKFAVFLYLWPFSSFFCDCRASLFVIVVVFMRLTISFLHSFSLVCLRVSILIRLFTPSSRIYFHRGGFSRWNGSLSSFSSQRCVHSLSLSLSLSPNLSSSYLISLVVSLALRFSSHTLVFSKIIFKHWKQCFLDFFLFFLSLSFPLTSFSFNTKQILLDSWRQLWTFACWNFSFFRFPIFFCIFFWLLES